MTGIINFFREGWVVEPQIVGKLFYFGGEPIDTSAEGNDPQGLYTHFLTCSDPDVSPNSCDECLQTASFSDGSVVEHSGDYVNNIQEISDALIKYYNELGPSNWDKAEYRPYFWTADEPVVVDANSANKYKSVKLLFDKDGDIWYALAELEKPISIGSAYIDKLDDHFKDD